MTTPSTCDLTSLILEVNRAGFLVNNLFQTGPDEWQANLRTSTFATCFGYGPTPYDSLAEAFANSETLVPLIVNPPAPWTLSAPAPAPNLLALLGLAAPPATPGQPLRRI